MKWFDGTITQAVQTSKAKKSVFIVYIAGDDKVSTEVSKAVEDKNVEAVQQESQCIAVKIHANSEDCGFFSQIYPVVVVPSIFFIGENGVPLEVIGGSISPDNLITKINTVIEVNKSNILSSTIPGKKPQSPPPVPSSPVSDDAAAPSTSTDTNSHEKEDVQKRVSKAEELIEKRREDKMKKNFEDSRKKEEDKRQLGKDLQRLKQFQKEKEMSEIQEQLKKEKQADKIARQNVKEQIARDRAERAEKYNKEKKERDDITSEAKKAKLQAEHQAAVEAEAKRSETARIQFRLPDGSSLPHNFPSEETLQTVVNFISQHVGYPVVLSTTFPRRTFDGTHMKQTLISLTLAPSAVLMVVPERTAAVTPRSVGGSSDILSLLLMPFMLILNLLRSLFGGSSQESAAPPPPAPSSSSVGGNRKSSQAYDRQTDGNIRRFRNNQDDDDDDENATWNGNSTQQM